MNEITENTKYIDFVEIESFIDQETKDQIIKASQTKYGDYYDLEVGDFIDFIDPNTERYKVLDDPDISVFQVYWFIGFKEFIENFMKLIQNFTVKETPEELAASKNCYPTEFAESMLIFSRSYFGLHSFKEATHITLGDFILAKKDSYNSTVFQKTYSNIIMKK
jgi:hypothetical protein